jgi:hypothetical protein
MTQVRGLLQWPASVLWLPMPEVCYREQPSLLPRPLRLRLELRQDACCQPHVLLLPRSCCCQAAGAPGQGDGSFRTAAKLPLLLLLLVLLVLVLLSRELLVLLVLLHEGERSSRVVGDGHRITGGGVLGANCDKEATWCQPYAWHACMRLIGAPVNGRRG